MVINKLHNLKLTNNLVLEDIPAAWSQREPIRSPPDYLWLHTCVNIQTCCPYIRNWNPLSNDFGRNHFGLVFCDGCRVPTTCPSMFTKRIAMGASVTACHRWEVNVWQILLRPRCRPIFVQDLDEERTLSGFFFFFYEGCIQAKLTRQQRWLSLESCPANGHHPFCSGWCSFLFK